MISYLGQEKEFFVIQLLLCVRCFAFDLLELSADKKAFSFIEISRSLDLGQITLPNFEEIEEEYEDSDE